jgi:hypothetical protein
MTLCSRALAVFAFAASLTVSGVAAAAATKTYQVTGPVLAVTDTTITVQKGKEKWELARSKETKVTGGDPKVGDKVTIEYTMTAVTVEVKGGGKAEKSDKGGKPEPAPQK